MSFCFVFLDVTDETSISYFFVFWQCRFLSEVYGVGAFNSVANTLCEPSKLVGKGGFPMCLYRRPLLGDGILGIDR